MPILQRSAVLAQIDEKLNNWAACADGLLLKTERDHSFSSSFEECHWPLWRRSSPS